MSEVSVAAVTDKALDKATILVEKTAEVATDIFSAAAGIVTKGIEQYGPQVIDAVLWVVRIDAIQSLILGWGFAFICIFVVGYIWTGYTRRDWGRRIKNNGNDGMEIIPIGVVGFLALFFFMITAFPKITDIWLYTAVVKPELYLVKKTIMIVEKKLEVQTNKE